MERYVRGDAQAMEALFHRHAPRLHAFFARAFHDASTCDDLLQNTFLKLHTSRSSYASGLPLRPWLYTLAARVRVDELRRRYRARHRGDVSLDDLPAADEPSIGAAPDDSAARVRRGIASLPEGQRIVVLLHRFEELTFAEVATVLTELEGHHVREGAVRVRAFRAYGALRAALGDPDHAPSKEGP